MFYSAQKAQAGSQKAIGFTLVDVKDFPLPDMLTSSCLPAATTRDTVGHNCRAVVSKFISASGDARVTITFRGITSYKLASMCSKTKQCE